MKREVIVEWSEMEVAQSRLAEVARRRLIEPGVVLVGTIRRDGTPRISPVEPLVLDGKLRLSMMLHSTKAADLLRDPRILVHSVITDRDGTEGEFKVRGTALEQSDPGLQRRYAEAVAEELGWSPQPGRFHLFAVDIDDVTYVRYEATGDQYLVSWPPAREFVRRATSPTSVGEPEAVVDILQ